MQIVVSSLQCVFSMLVLQTYFQVAVPLLFSIALMAPLGGIVYDGMSGSHGHGTTTVVL